MSDIVEQVKRDRLDERKTEALRDSYKFSDFVRHAIGERLYEACDRKNTYENQGFLYFRGHKPIYATFNQFLEGGNIHQSYKVGDFRFDNIADALIEAEERPLDKKEKWWNRLFRW